jgi:hypothetical protein
MNFLKSIRVRSTQRVSQHRHAIWGFARQRRFARLQYMSISDTLGCLASGHRGRGRVLLDQILSL